MIRQLKIIDFFKIVYKQKNIHWNVHEHINWKPLLCLDDHMHHILPCRIFQCRPVKQLGIASSPHTDPSNFFKYAPGCFSLCKSRTVGRTRCDCFHTQEVITPDLPQLWLRLINIDKQLMRCQAGTRPFPSCLLMTPMERKNDLDQQCHCLSQVRSKSR